MSIQTRIALGFGSGALAVAMLGFGGVTPPSPPTPSYGAGGSYTYLNYSAQDIWEEERIERQRKKTINAPVVYQAAVQAVSNNYYGDRKEQNEAALLNLKKLSLALNFEIGKIDRVLLKREIARLRKIQDADDEEVLIMLT